MIRISTRRLPHDYALALGTALALFGAPALMPAQFGGAAVYAQAVFATPEAAANAFTDALATNDQGAMKHVLGNDFTEFIPTQNIGQDDIDDYLGAWAKGHRVVPDETPVAGKASAHVEVGDSGWTLPVPIVQSGKGWHFDPREGASEILTRRMAARSLRPIRRVRISLAPSCGSKCQPLPDCTIGMGSVQPLSPTST